MSCPTHNEDFLVHSVSVLYLGATCAHAETRLPRAHTCSTKGRKKVQTTLLRSCGKGQYMSSNAKHSSGGRYSISSAKPGRMESGEGPCRRTIEGHSETVLGVAFSPDGQYLASGSTDGTVKLWHVESGECTRTMEGHSHEVLSVAFSPDGQYLASGSQDNTVKLWSTPDRERSLQTMERVYALLSSLKHNKSAPHRSVYQLGQHGGGPFPIIQAMFEWWDPEWFV